MLAIVDTIASIPPGRVSSYGQVAAIAGLPGRARLVARTLRYVPDDRHVPWFRVLRSDGGIAFPEGSSGYNEQSRLLRREGVEVVRGRVDVSRFGWRRSLDELLWAPPPDAVIARKSARKVTAKKSPAKKAARQAAKPAKKAARKKPDAR